MTEAIVVGKTQFRWTYADSNPLWVVTRKVGKDTFEATSQDEPIEIDGKIYEGDYAGIVQAFRGDDIRRAVDFDQRWAEAGNANDQFYAQLRLGQVVHYDNGFTQFIRCEVVEENGEKQLKPIALIGNWRDGELVTRYPNGDVRKSYHVEQVESGRPFHPHFSCIWEAYGPAKRKDSMRFVTSIGHLNDIGKARHAELRYQVAFDPTKEQPLTWELPPMSPKEEQVARLWEAIEEIKDMLSTEELYRSTEPKQLEQALYSVGLVLRAEGIL